MRREEFIHPRLMKKLLDCTVSNQISTAIHCSEPFLPISFPPPTLISHLRSHGYQALAETLHNFRKTMDPLQLQRSVCIFASVSLGMYGVGRGHALRMWQCLKHILCQEPEYQIMPRLTFRQSLRCRDLSPFRVGI